MNINHLIAAVMNAAAQRLRPLNPNPGLPQHLGQHNNPRRSAQRRQVKAHGARQARKIRKAGTRAEKALAEMDECSRLGV